MNYLGMKLINSVELSLIGELAEAKANLDVYLEAPVGIGEHSSLTTEVRLLVERIANAKDAIQVISEVKKNGNS